MNRFIRIRSSRPQRGFSLVEVLVALIVLSVGLLGLAKMQGLAYSSTSNSSERSLAALEVSSLISAMRANRAYWTNISPSMALTLTGASITGNSALASSNGYKCQAGVPGSIAPCTPTQLAGYDLQTWATNLSTLLPNVTGSIQCTAVTATVPTGCWVQLTWVERTTAINNQSLTSVSTAMAAPTYTLYVVP